MAAARDGAATRLGPLQSRPRSPEEACLTRWCEWQVSLRDSDHLGRILGQLDKAGFDTSVMMVSLHPLLHSPMNE